MRRFLAVLPTLLLLWALVAQLNHELAAAHVFLFVGGLFVTYTSLSFPLGAGMAASFVAGLVLDANSPVAFGTHALLFAAAHALLYDLKDRMPRDDMGMKLYLAFLGHCARTLEDAMDSTGGRSRRLANFFDEFR